MGSLWGACASFGLLLATSAAGADDSHWQKLAGSDCQVWNEAPEPKEAAEPKEAPEAPPAKPDRAEEKARLRKGLAKTRGGFIARLGSLFSSKKTLDKEMLDQVEEILFTADIGVRTSQLLIDSIRNETVVEDESARDVFEVAPRGVAEAIARALHHEDRQFASLSSAGRIHRNLP